MADAISRLDFTPPLPCNKKEERQNWLTFTKCWCALKKDTQTHSTKQHLESMNLVFANRSDNEQVPLTIKEIAMEQHSDKSLHALLSDDNYEMLLIENTKVRCKNGKLVIPKSLQNQVVQWYHHYLQHPGKSCLEETIKAAMKWKSMCTTI